MKNQNLYKKDDLFKDEEEPIPEKYTPPINSPKKPKIKSRNQIKEIQIKSNTKSKSLNKFNKILNTTKNNNISQQLSRSQTTLNNINTYKFENFNRQNQYYKFQKTYLNLHPDINRTFIERMEFDVVKRHIKEKEINKLIDDNTIKIEEEKRAQTFHRLYKDANRRNEALDNLEKTKSVLDNNNDLSEKPLKKYSDEQWKKIYEERFKNYMEKIKEKNEIKIKKKLELKIKKENDEINLCKVHKANKKHIKEKANKMYTEALKREMKHKEKKMRLNNNKKHIYNNTDGINYSNKKSKKKNKESKYNFNNDSENENNYLNNKSNNISNYIIEKNSSNSQSMHDSKNIGKILDNFFLENNPENKNNNIKQISKIKMNNNNISNIGKEKKIKYNFFVEINKGQNYKNELDKLNSKDELNNNFNIDKIDNTNISDNTNKNLYIKEVSYIIEQFFLRKK